MPIMGLRRIIICDASANSVVLRNTLSSPPVIISTSNESARASKFNFVEFGTTDKR